MYLKWCLTQQLQYILHERVDPSHAGNVIFYANQVNTMPDALALHHQVISSHDINDMNSARQEGSDFQPKRFHLPSPPQYSQVPL